MTVDGIRDAFNAKVFTAGVQTDIPRFAKFGRELVQVLLERISELEADVVRLKGECGRAWNEVNRCNKQVLSLTYSLNEAMDAKSILARRIDEPVANPQPEKE